MVLTLSQSPWPQFVYPTASTIPIRPTYANLYSWPESDAEFMKKICCNVSMGPHSQPRVVDSLSCRQMYLRSYTFSRKKEGVIEKTLKCLRRVSQRVVFGCGRIRSYCKGRKKEYLMLRRAKDASCSALFSMFRWLLSCFAKVQRWMWLIIEKTLKCLSRVSQRVVFGCGRIRSYCKGRKKEYLMLRRAKDASCSALFSMFRWLLSCFAKVQRWMWLIIVQIYNLVLQLQLTY